MEQVSRPGRRVMLGEEIPEVLGGLQISIVSTSKGSSPAGRRESRWAADPLQRLVADSHKVTVSRIGRIPVATQKSRS
jgi:hypothetical protein